jgi:uncharacterized RDD family membrane protein YckC
MKPGMKSRFEPDDDANACTSARLIDPDEFDASEQQFAASLELPPSPMKANFVLDADEEVCEKPPLSPQGLTITESSIDPEPRLNNQGDIANPLPTPETQEEAAVVASQTEGIHDPDSWRNEVAARVTKYRARRRPREPRYPSLQLKFEPYEPIRSNPSAAESPVSPPVNRQAVALDSVLAAAPSPEPQERILPHAGQETSARILEFPRSSFASVPPMPLDELAEPVFDRPRILEAPEIAPPPPALGGILIEPLEEPAAQRRPGFEVPLQSARMSRRLAAVAMDALVVLSALSAFSYIFFRITATVPPLPRAAGTIVALASTFWVAYQYLLLVYTGTTPGLKLAKLRLDRFDGRSVPRNIRRWRVLASALSGLSLGLGYAWCFLDEDELCWHDRITRTYMAPIK